MGRSVGSAGLQPWPAALPGATGAFSGLGLTDWVSHARLTPIWQLENSDSGEAPVDSMRRSRAGSIRLALERHGEFLMRRLDDDHPGILEAEELRRRERGLGFVILVIFSTLKIRAIHIGP